jgi:hypothetical protein
LESLVTQLFADGYLELPELMYSEQPKTVGLDSTYTPFAQENIKEGTPTGKGTVLTLSNGRYDEFKNAKRIETIGSVRFNTEKNKIVGFGENKRQVEVVSRFLSVDPIAASYPELTPYQFASNTPIWAIDLDGLEASIAVYGAGKKEYKKEDGTVKVEYHKSLFKMEAERDVKWKNANIVYSAITGAKLIEALENETKKECSIGYLSIFSHSSSINIILDNGELGKEALGIQQWKGYTLSKLSAVFDNSAITFDKNALVVFAGCNAGRITASDGTKDKIYSIAEAIAKTYGIATIGAEGYTSPTSDGQGRQSDYGYFLYLSNGQNVTPTRIGLGKILNENTVKKAQQYILLRSAVNAIQNTINENAEAERDTELDTN